MKYFCIVARGSEQCAAEEIKQALKPLLEPVCILVHDATSGQQCHANGGRTCIYFESSADRYRIASLRSVECVCSWVMSGALGQERTESSLFEGISPLDPRLGRSLSTCVYDAYADYCAVLDAASLRSNRVFGTIGSSGLASCGNRAYVDRIILGSIDPHTDHGAETSLLSRGPGESGPQSGRSGAPPASSTSASSARATSSATTHGWTGPGDLQQWMRAMKAWWAAQAAPPVMGVRFRATAVKATTRRGAGGRGAAGAASASGGKKRKRKRGGGKAAGEPFTKLSRAAGTGSSASAESAPHAVQGEASGEAAEGAPCKPPAAAAGATDEESLLVTELSSVQIAQATGDAVSRAYSALALASSPGLPSPGAPAALASPLEVPFPSLGVPLTVSLKEFDMEVVAVVEGTCIHIGIGLHRGSMLEAQHRQHLLGRQTAGSAVPRPVRLPVSKVGLRGNIAYTMLRWARPGPGDVVLDCMCGAGYLAAEAHRVAGSGSWHRSRGTVEAASGVSDAVHAGMRGYVVVAGELDLKALCPPEAMPRSAAGGSKPSKPASLAAADSKCPSSAVASANGEAASEPDPYPFDRCLWDAMRLPLRPGTIDVVLVDLPFGNRCRSKYPLQHIYTRAVQCIATALRPPSSPSGEPVAGRAVLLTSNGRALADALAAEPRLDVLRARPVDNGGIGCLAVIVRRRPIAVSSGARASHAPAASDGAESHVDRVRAVMGPLTSDRKRARAAKMAEFRRERASGAAVPPPGTSAAGGASVGKST